MKSPLSDELTQELAKQQVERFVARFKPSYRYLACHCALPLVLTPELVNYIRVQFLLNEEVPWIAEADLLLSDLCRPVGYELYAMSPAVRSNLLAKFKEREFQQKFGANRLKSVAQLLMDYVTYLMRTHPTTRQAELQAQQWAAMVYLDEHRNQAEEEIATALQALVNRGKNGQAELARLQRLIEEFQPQLSQYDSLIEFSQLLATWLKGQIPPNAGQSYAVHGVKLRLPTPTPTPELKTILLVEDELEVIAVIREVLSSEYGIAVEGTDEVNEVIKLAESGQIDLILINYGLPNSRYQNRKVDGLEIVRILRGNPNISSSLPIVGFSLDLVASEFRISGANGFYSKEELFDSGDYQKFVDYLVFAEKVA